MYGVAAASTSSTYASGQAICAGIWTFQGNSSSILLMG